MKSSRFQYEYRENASSYHKAVGECLRNSSIFGGYRIYQEYPVNKVNPSYTSPSHRYDWVILDLKLIIEVHGEFHYKEIRVGGITEEQAADNLYAQQQRDERKMDAAIDAGYTYIIIKHSEIRGLSDGWIWKLYEEATEEVVNTAPKKSFRDKIREQQREQRKRQYGLWRDLRRRRQSDEDNSNGPPTSPQDEEIQDEE